jgi:HEAT repeat protein
LPRLVRALYDPSLEVRREAILALGALGPAARPSGPALSVLLSAPPHTSELCALWALVRVGGPGSGRALPFLRESLRHRHPLVRMIAAHLAPWAPGSREELGPDLLRALGDPEHFVRLEAVRALGQVGGRGAAGSLRRAAARDPMLGAEVDRALAGLGG